MCGVSNPMAFMSCANSLRICRIRFKSREVFSAVIRNADARKILFSRLLPGPREENKAAHLVGVTRTQNQSSLRLLGKAQKSRSAHGERKRPIWITPGFRVPAVDNLLLCSHFVLMSIESVETSWLSRHRT